MNHHNEITVHSQGKILSKRELELLLLIALENTTPEIAQKLYISKGTVDTHRYNMLQKLGVKNTAGMIRKSFELGLLQLPQREQLLRAV